MPRWTAGGGGRRASSVRTRVQPPIASPKPFWLYVYGVLQYKSIERYEGFGFTRHHLDRREAQNDRPVYPTVALELIESCPSYKALA